MYVTVETEEFVAAASVLMRRPFTAPVMTLFEITTLLTMVLLLMEPMEIP